MSYFIGLDIGTSAVKAILCDKEGRIVAITQQEYPLYTPQPLWSEQNPADWWQGSIKAIQQLLAQSDRCSRAGNRDWPDRSDARVSFSG